MKRAVLLVLMLTVLTVPSAAGQSDDDCDFFPSPIPCLPGPDDDYDVDGDIDEVDQAIVDALLTGDCSGLIGTDVECDPGEMEEERGTAPDAEVDAPVLPALPALPVQATPTATG